MKIGQFWTFCVRKKRNRRIRTIRTSQMRKHSSEMFLSRSDVDTQQRNEVGTEHSAWGEIEDSLRKTLFDCQPKVMSAIVTAGGKATKY